MVLGSTTKKKINLSVPSASSEAPVKWLSDFTGRRVMRIRYHAHPIGHRMRRFFLTGISILIISTLCAPARGSEVTLAWDPNDEPDLAGYNVYVNQVGPGPPYYRLDTVSLDEIEPDNPMYTATGLKNESYYCFVLTAYDSEGFESGFSNEVCVLNGQQVALNISQNRGGGGGGCFIKICSD